MSGEKKRMSNSSDAGAVPFAAQHTPGPWSIHTEHEAPHRHIVMNDAIQQRVCMVPQYAEVDHAANARLIAAAPTMLKALKAVGSCIAPRAANNDELWGVYSQVIAAIVSATNGAADEKAGITQLREAKEPSSELKCALQWLDRIALLDRTDMLGSHARTIQSELLRLKSLNAELREGLENIERHAAIIQGERHDEVIQSAADIIADEARSLLSRTT